MRLCSSWSATRSTDVSSVRSADVSIRGPCACAVWTVGAMASHGNRRLFDACFRALREEENFLSVRLAVENGSVSSISALTTSFSDLPSTSSISTVSVSLSFLFSLTLPLPVLPSPYLHPSPLTMTSLLLATAWSTSWDSETDLLAPLIKLASNG